MKEFKALGLPPEVDDFFTILFIIIFLLTVCINYNVCGGGAVAVFKEKYDIDPSISQDSYLISDDEKDSLIYLRGESQDYYNFKENFIYFVQQQTDMYFKQSNKGFWLGMLLFWVIMPLVLYYYAFFGFKKDMWERAKVAEDLYTSLYYSNNRGELK